ncbi:hypothetical protein L211DRAFT_515828 [Terfezia boudieri ATCC MYA-4762]|uniref:Uncharacterized protein n=1 Tax=Terfezia boudieri ATCC MYA-4762 TaxID=1051890 RepID=A0A3N4LCA7_9PEZI|nr:hypothetical protein L211DRAFT_515828 [Terfezia boudieri ATCC MYA-4762]
MGRCTYTIQTVATHAILVHFKTALQILRYIVTYPLLYILSLLCTLYSIIEVIHMVCMRHAYSLVIC